MTLDQIFQHAKLYCKAVTAAQVIGTRIAFYDENSTALFAVDLNVEAPVLDMLNFKGEISGGFLASFGWGETYDQLFPLMATAVYYTGPTEKFLISSPSNFKKLVEEYFGEKYAFVQSPNTFHEWSVLHVRGTAVHWPNYAVNTITLKRTLHYV